MAATSNRRRRAKMRRELQQLSPSTLAMMLHREVERVAGDRNRELLTEAFLELREPRLQRWAAPLSPEERAHELAVMARDAARELEALAVRA